MPFNNLIDRANDADALIPEEESRQILQGTIENSAIMRLGRQMQNMPTKKRKMPVLNLMPTAYFVDGDTGLKQTTEMAWGNKYLIAEEIAAIVPIPEAVLDDADYDIWGEVRPRLQEAFGKAFDAAVFHGTNAPADWPDDLATAAAAAGNSVDLSVQEAASEDLYDVIMGEDGVISKVEADGFMATGHVGAISMRGKLRGLRDTTGQPIFKRSMQDNTRYELDGGDMFFPKNGALNPASVLMFSGDFDQLIWCYRQDITFKLLTEAVITDGSTPPQIIYNLAQQDMVALRAVMRIAWQVPNPINSLQPTEGSRFPFSILVP